MLPHDGCHTTSPTLGLVGWGDGAGLLSVAERLSYLENIRLRPTV